MIFKNCWSQDHQWRGEYKALDHHVANKFHRHYFRVNTLLMKQLLTFLFIATALMGWSQTTDSLIVGLTDGTTLYPSTLKYKTPTFGSSHLLIDKERKIALDQVRFYQDDSGYYVFDRVDGNNRIRLKREMQGRVNTFSRIVSTYTPGVGMPGTAGATMGTFNSSKVGYYKKGSGNIREINYENLRGVLADNQASMAKLEKVKSLKRLNTYAYVGGGALLVAGLVHMGNLNKTEGPPPYDGTMKFSPLVFIGAAAFTIPLFTGKAKQDRLKEAIEVYNE